MLANFSLRALRASARVPLNSKSCCQKTPASITLPKRFAKAESVDPIRDLNFDSGAGSTFFGLDKDTFTFKAVNVGAVLKKKGSKEILTIHEDDTVYTAIEKMEKHGVGSAVVVCKNDRLSGIITERDYLDKVFLKGYRSPEVLVKVVMTKDPITVTETTLATDCLKIMTDKRFRHLPVVDVKGQLKGLISIGDIVKNIVDQQTETIQYQREYINRTY